MTESGPLGPESAPATEGVLTAEDSALRARRDRIAAKSGGSLRVHAARGVMINAAFSIVLQGLSVFRGFVAASFIAPADYAVWSIIVIGFTAIGQLKQVGIVDKYIQQDDPDEEVAFQKAFTLEAILTGGMGLVLAAATPLLALAYRAPEIIAPALVGLLALPANILQTPIWAYQREMEFTRTRMLAAVDPVVGAIATIAGAIAGAGYWSFVLGVVLGSWAGALVVVTRSPYRLRFRYERGTTRQYVRFSVPILFAKLSNSFLLTGVLLVARSAIGLAGIGAMSLSNSIRLYTEFADAIISDTMYPAVTAIKDRAELMFESFVKSNRMALMWGAPFGLGAALFASDLLTFVLGRHWLFAVDLFRAVGVVSAIGHVAFNWDDYVRASGDTRPIAKYAWLGLIGWSLGPIPLMLTDGLRGYSIGLLFVSMVTLTLRGYFAHRLFSQFAIVTQLARGFTPCVPAVIAVLAVRAAESGHRTPLEALAELVLYLGIVGLVTWLTERELLREAIGYLRRARATPSPATV